MKSLDLKQMEKVEGGGCTERTVLLALGITALAIVSIGTGFTITAGILAGMVANGSSAAALVASGDCF